MAAAESQTQDSSGMSSQCSAMSGQCSAMSGQCSATEPQQPDNHQPSQSSMYTAQVVLNASVVHLAATQHVPSELR